MTEIESLLKKLYQTIGDTVQRSIVADWYEENGFIQKAKAHRYISQNNKQPFYYGSTNSYFWTMQYDYPGYDLSVSNVLEKETFNKLENHITTSVTLWKDYKSPQDAINALIKVLEEIL